MPTPKALRRHNLTGFRDSILDRLPNVKVLNPHDALFAQAASLGLEAAGWLTLGSDLDFFDADEAANMWKNHYSSIVEYESEKLYRVPHFDSRLLTNSQDLMSPYRYELFRDPCRLQSVFQELLIKLASANADYSLPLVSGKVLYKMRQAS